MKNAGILLLLACLPAVVTSGQSITEAIYPIGAKPNIGYKSGKSASEAQIVFEANPVLRMPLYNDIQQALKHQKGKGIGTAAYLGFYPQLRMYDEASLPVKTPSYKISILGLQQVYRLKPSKKDHTRLLAYAIESGHYSNGQSKCAFHDAFDDGSAACDSICSTIKDTDILSRLLNRRSGNFSTNYTDIAVNYRVVLEHDGSNRPQKTVSFNLGWQLFHDRLLHIANIGGFSHTDIRNYGRHRFTGGIEYIKQLHHKSRLQIPGLKRFSLALQAELIAHPHPSVDPLRIELTGHAYFHEKLGFFISGIRGHDNYNYRFVDSGTQFFAGIAFDIFPPVTVKP